MLMMILMMMILTCSDALLGLFPTGLVQCSNICMICIMLLDTVDSTGETGNDAGDSVSVSVMTSLLLLECI